LKSKEKSINRIKMKKVNDIQKVVNDVLIQFEHENALDVCFKLVKESKKKKEKLFWLNVMKELESANKV
jgi:hypothetical protein